jgi:hypothetical protein
VVRSKPRRISEDSLKIIDILKTCSGLEVSNKKRLARSADLILP